LSSGENAVYRAASIVVLGASAVLAASISTEWFTPVFMLRSKGLPGAKWLVALAEAWPLILIATNRLGWGYSLALLFAMANVLALPFNFFGAWVGSGYDGRTDPAAVRFWWFYVFQIVLVFVSWRASRLLEASERRYGRAALVVGAWAMLFFVIARLTTPPAIRQLFQ
jgi:hypothetical protein